ncbi:MAG: xylulokinase [Sulfobacillus acidophilus]|uniref:Xylulose kinase n=1 Tax=Sulfobacillus acidophilus TaxID=53633 RepID=A0A2T2WJL1_9FIRM|nr:MAG: xylulokinase [Sulfobacillus acidophilus]
MSLTGFAPVAYLGLDIGTQGLKAVVVTDSGHVLFETSAIYPTAVPTPGWAEQSPGDWMAALDSVLGQVDQAGLSVTWAGIGVTGQMHTVVVCDDRGQPLRPAILWSDQRAREYGPAWEAKYGLKWLREQTGNKPLSNFSLGYLRWIRDHEWTVYQQIRHVAIAKDWVRFVLTGAWGTEMTDASGTYLLDVAHRHWATDWMREMGMDPSWWGTLHESGDVVGTMQYGPSRFRGLPVVAGAGDQAASAIGTQLTPGELGISLGTSGVLFWPLRQYVNPPHPSIHVFCHAVADEWHWMTVTQSAASSLRWFRDQFYADTPYAIVDREAEIVPAGCSGVIFVPYLEGERAPVMQPQASGVFFGLRAYHGRTHLARAVLEGVAYSLNDCYQTMFGREAPKPQRLVMTGGGARSVLWTQILADVLGEPLEIVEDPGAAVGAAWIAHSAVDATQERWPRASIRTAIPGANAAYYQTEFHRYRRLTRVLSDVWESSAEALSADS